MKKWLSLGLKIGVTLAIVAVIATKTDVRKIATLLTSIGGGVVCIVLLLNIVQTVVNAYRWVVVMRGVGVTVDLWPALQAIYVSLALNQFTPSYVGGDAYRIYWLYREGNRLALAARGVMIDRISAIIALVVMMAVGLPLVFGRFADPMVHRSLLVVLACGVAGTLAFFTCDVAPASWRRIRMVRELAELSAAARRLLLSGTAALVIGPLALVVHMLSALAMVVLANGLGLPLTLLDCVLLIPPITLLSAVPVSISGWGVREGVMVGALSLLGIPAEPALALSILLGFGVLANGLIGLLPMAFGGERFVATRGRIAAASGVGADAA